MLKIKYTLSLVGALLLILTGCAIPGAPGPKFSGLQNIPGGNAELIVYRKSAFFAAAQAMPLLIDDSQVGELYNGSFLQHPLAPGKHKIKVSTGPFSQSVETTIQFPAGERKFLHFDFPTGPLANIYFIGITLDERDVSTALADLKELNSAKLALDGKQ